MILKRLLLLILVSALFSACGTSLYYSEFIYPSKVFVPADLHKVGLVNHSASPTSTAPVYNAGELVENATGLPLRTANKVLDAIESENEAMGRYNIVRLDWDNESRPGALKKGSEITLAQADSICLWDLVDGLIIAEGVDLKLDASGTQQPVEVYDNAGNRMRVTEFAVTTKLQLTMRWRMYDYVRKTFIDEYEETYNYVVDSITYDAKVASQLKPQDMSMAGVAYAAAVDYYARIAPHWMEDYRAYYQTGNSEMYRIATDLEYDGDWEKAGLAWKELIDNPNEKVAHRALYNMAVTNEMLGMPVDAKIWLEQAEAIKSTSQTKQYMEKLEEQIIIYELVRRQLGLPSED